MGPIFNNVPFNFLQIFIYSLSGSIIYCSIPNNLLLNINVFVKKDFPAPLVPKTQILAFLYFSLLYLSTNIKELFSVLFPIYIPSSSNIDDEGIPTQRNVLIKDGILKSYMVDKLNGRRMKTDPTGSSRRQSYKFAPTSRMTNTFIAPGNDKVEDIIKSIDDGLYAKKMGGGSVNPVTGEFNFAVAEGYLVKNGEIKEAVRGASLIGKGSEVLMNIDMVGDNLAQAQGMCGSVSGSIPTNVGQPMIRVKEITVGGRSEE